MEPGQKEKAPKPEEVWVPAAMEAPEEEDEAEGLVQVLDLEETQKPMKPRKKIKLVVKRSKDLF